MEGKGLPFAKSETLIRLLYAEFTVLRETGFAFLKKIIRRVFVGNLGFTLASLTYITAHIFDYLLTIRGLKTTAIAEGNPIIRGYMDFFGMEAGLLGYKLFICIGLIIGLKAIDLARRERKTRIRAESILYGGAVLTTSGGALWLLSF